MYRVDPVLRQIAHINTGRQVRNFFEDSPGELWIATDSGLIRSDRNNEALHYFLNDPKKPASISRDIVMDVYRDRKGFLWIGTGNGLNLFNKQNNTFSRFQHDPKNPGSISEGIVTSMVDDHDGAFWIGTENGLDLMDRQKGSFKHYLNDPKDSGTISKNAVYSLIEDKSGKLWVGSWNGGGINLLNRETGKFKHYLPGNNIFTIYQDAIGVIWAGTEFGLYRYNTTNDNFSLFTDPASEIATANIVSIVEDDKKNLWIGS